MTTEVAAPIVVGLDNSPAAQAALDWAVAEANRRHLPLRLVHAVEWHPYGPIPGGPKTDRGDRHEEIVSHAREHVLTSTPDLETTTDTIDGGAPGVLVGESHHAAMVVVGHRGRGELASLLTGSVGVQTAAHAHCPVIVVRPHLPESAVVTGARHGVGRVVVGVDGSTLSRAAVHFAFEEAELRGVGVTAVHAWRYPLSTGTGEPLFAVYEHADIEPGHELLAESLAGERESHPRVPVREVTAFGNAAPILIHESAGAELLAVGSHGRSRFAGLILGSVSEAAIRHAGCPVAVIH